VSNLDITRAEAAERSQLVSNVNYDVTLDLSVADATYPARTVTTFDATEGASTWIDHVAPSVKSIVLNGTELDPAQVFNGARIALANLAEHNELIVESDAQYMNTGEGLHRFVDPVDKETYLYTQFETADSRRVFTAFEQPDIKAVWTLTVTTPAHWRVISNSPTPEPVSDGDKATWNFAPSPKLSTYVYAIVAGPYEGVEDSFTGSYGTYPLGVYVRRSLRQFLDYEDIIEVTKQGFAWFEEKFQTPYPFGKYDQIFVPEFNAGAMENAGCVTHRDEYVFRSRTTRLAYDTRANTILHELAHMWFGDLVTMRWWDDLWLNESFAEWASHWASEGATQYTEAWTTFHIQRKAWAYRQDQLPSTHPIAADMPNLDSVYENFDGITYAKGASALSQLVSYVGEDNFLRGLKTYFDKHAWGNTSLSDLLEPLAEESGRDTASWAASWLQTAGVNTLRPVIEIDAEGNFSKIGLEQSPPTMPPGLPPVLRPHRLAVGAYNLTPEGLTLTQRSELDVVGEYTEVTEFVGKPQPDLLLINDDDLTYSKIRLDPKSVHTAQSHLGSISDPLTRALIWGASWDMLRDAEISTRDYLRLVLAGIGHEDEIGVVQTVLRQLRTAIDQYAAPENRDSYLEQLADGLHHFAEQAAAGSDHQLAYVRGFASSAITVDQLSDVQALLDGTKGLEGLVIDTDLRWLLLSRLVITGHAGLAAIESELERDNTAAGHEQATTLRTALPTPEAKTAAWDLLLNDTTLPNRIVEALLVGFAEPDQRELTRAYVTPYFENVLSMWDSRTHEIGSLLATLLYPAILVEDSVVTATDEFLAAHADLPTGLRRILAEQRDSLLRALRAVAVDRG
jgi:aminopeptidase N